MKIIKTITPLKTITSLMLLMSSIGVNAMTSGVSEAQDLNKKRQDISAQDFVPTVFCDRLLRMAWKQGNDLYGLFDNLIHRATEYTARYNAGHDDVPFRKWTDVTGKYCDREVISPKNGGDYWSLYGCVYNHYANRKHIPMPNTLEILERNGWKAIYTGIGMDYDLFQFTDRFIDSRID